MVCHCANQLNIPLTEYARRVLLNIQYGEGASSNFYRYCQFRFCVWQQRISNEKIYLINIVCKERDADFRCIACNPFACAKAVLVLF